MAILEIFFYPSQSKHATSQCKRRIQTSWRTSSKTLDWTPISKLYFYIDYILIWIFSLTKYMIVSLLSQIVRINLNLIYNFLACMNILISMHKILYVFDDVRNKLVSAACALTLNVFIVANENHKRCLFRILSVNVPS